MVEMAGLTPNTNPSSSSTSNISLLRNPPNMNKNPFFFEGGDVIITVKHEGEVLKGRVSSGCMAAASSVWKLFLYPPWSKPGESPVSELDFTEDNSAALLILLHIVHLQFSKVPKTFTGSISLLHNISMLCEQYDCIYLTHVFAASWLKRLSNTTLPMHQGDLRRKAYIAWAFGDSDRFRQVAKELVLKCRIQANGTLDDGESILPEGLIERAQRARSLTLKKLLAIPYGQLAVLQSELMMSEDVDCVLAIHGSLADKLSACGLLPKKEPGNLFDSVATIAGLIEDLDVRWPGCGNGSIISAPNHGIYSQRGSHYDCGVNYKREVRKVLRTIQDPTLDSHIRHMELRKSAMAAGKEDVLPGDGSAAASIIVHSPNNGGIRSLPPGYTWPYSRCEHCAKRHSRHINCRAKEESHRAKKEANQAKSKSLMKRLAGAMN